MVFILIGAVVALGAYIGLTRTSGDGAATAEPAGGRSLRSSTTPVASGPPCPQYVINEARSAGRPGNLVSLIYVRGPRIGVTNPRDSEAWICQDSDGALFYAGHRITDDPPIPNVNTILVGGGVRGSVVEVGDHRYVAYVSEGRYLVSCDEYAVVFTDGRARQDFAVQTCVHDGGPTVMGTAA